MELISDIKCINRLKGKIMANYKFIENRKKNMNLWWWKRTLSIGSLFVL